ncbi:hypothetical protein LTR70_002222 [Exophiala xenobiotica]|uniref:Uncharacterized protein n=1 Tax=Lithohypha guttulata TaxID=1690604 RepID=A0ABR0KLN6_9EURO|nr:hypothetical protein LTR24_001357 [Lithohypha guttulata]KAK5325957.1 hypothetical protein LTR70_002222 [Exophiala xenobiotica]
MASPTKQAPLHDDYGERPTFQRNTTAAGRRNSPAPPSNRFHPYNNTPTRGVSPLAVSPAPSNHFHKPGRPPVRSRHASPRPQASHLNEAYSSKWMMNAPTDRQPLARSRSFTKVNSDNDAADSGNIRTNSGIPLLSRSKEDVAPENIDINSAVDETHQTVQAKNDEIQRLKAKLQELEKANDPRKLSYVSDSDLRNLKEEVAQGHEKITNLQEEMDKKGLQLQQVKNELAEEKKTVSNLNAHIEVLRAPGIAFRGR